jgi:hypothetical protein
MDWQLTLSRQVSLNGTRQEMMSKAVQQEQHNNHLELLLSVALYKLLGILTPRDTVG